MSEQNWTRTAIARLIASSSRAEYVEPIFDDELAGVGGRWELSIAGGSYVLERSDGLRLDRGRFRNADKDGVDRSLRQPGQVNVPVDGDRL